MPPDTAVTLAPTAHGPGEGEALWFFGGLTTIKVDAAGSAGRVTVTETVAKRGLGSPLHVHHREDEWFYVIEGELTFWVGGDTIVAPAGSFVYGPRDVPHTFVVSSEDARFLLVVEPAGFEEFVREVGVPAERREVPPADEGPPDVELVTSIAAKYGMDIVGPPGIPE